MTESFSSIPETVITRCALDQAECIENMQPLPQRNQYPYSAKVYAWKKTFEGGAGTVPLPKGEESED